MSPQSVFRLQKLLQCLAHIGPGPVDDNSHAVSLLAAAWDELSGGNDEGMTAAKVSRAESLTWKPPYLTFQIERHGGTVLGSKRAELHDWTINLDKGEASCAKASFRQLVTNAPPYTKTQAAAEAATIAALIMAGTESPMIKRRDATTLRIYSAVALPSKDAPKQTLAARRHRLKAALVDEMTKHGWRLLADRAPWTFGKCVAASG